MQVISNNFARITQIGHNFSLVFNQATTNYLYGKVFQGDKN